MQQTLIPKDFQNFLEGNGLFSGNKSLTGFPLTGGVSSDIWRVDLPYGSICIKRALPKLRVEADWSAPIERNAYEVAWLKIVAQILPHQVPSVLAHDQKAGMFAMPFLDPKEFEIWKNKLLAEDVDPKFAGNVGSALAKIHGATMDNPKISQEFKTDSIFNSIRLEPYLEATAQIHTDVAKYLYQLIANTKNAEKALVHGDISPKNILVGRTGPVFLDAECAWYGDPAFDLAFCLNHLLLKCLHAPKTKSAYLESFEELTTSYFQTIDCTRGAEIEKRASQLIAGLFLSRVDGKSPVEYITNEEDKNLVRRTAKRLLFDPVSRLSDVNAHWKTVLNN